MGGGRFQGFTLYWLIEVIKVRVRVQEGKSRITHRSGVQLPPAYLEGDLVPCLGVLLVACHTAGNKDVF